MDLLVSCNSQAYRKSIISPSNKPRRAPEDRTKDIARRLEERLIAAEQKRVDTINQVRARAAARCAHTARTAADVAAARHKRREHTVAKIESSLAAANAAREQRLNDVARRAAQHLQHTRNAAAAVKERDMELRERRHAALAAKLESAERRRREAALINGGAQQPLPTEGQQGVGIQEQLLHTPTQGVSYLSRPQMVRFSIDDDAPSGAGSQIQQPSVSLGAATGEVIGLAPACSQDEDTSTLLNLAPIPSTGKPYPAHYSAWRIQRGWRRFASAGGPGTSAALAAAFVETGIPGSAPIPQSPPLSFTLESRAAAGDYDRDEEQQHQEQETRQPIISGMAPTTPPQPTPILRPMKTTYSSVTNDANKDNSSMASSSLSMHVVRSAHSVADAASPITSHAHRPVGTPFSLSSHQTGFDEFAERLSSPVTLKATQAVLARIQSKGKTMVGNVVVTFDLALLSLVSSICRGFKAFQESTHDAY